MKTAILIVVFVILFTILSFGIWKIGKRINYNLFYKSMVEETVRDMVKKECLNATQE